MKRHILSALLLVCLSRFVHAGNAVVAGEFMIDPPTLECLGFEWDVKGDDNRNATVEVEYKTGWFGRWKRALPLLRIKGEVCGDEEKFTSGNLFAGSILDLRPDTAYKVKLTMTDPDGGGAAKSATIRTRPVPKSFGGGRTLHLYPITAGPHGDGYTDFAAAYAEAKLGDIILVHAGTYQTKTPHQKGQIDYLLNKRATAQRPIVIRGAGDGEAIFNGDGNELFHLAAADYHYFENLTLRDADQLIHAGRGDEHCVGLVVRHCKLEKSGFPIWALSGKCRDFYIADNTITGPALEWTPRDISGKKYGETHAIWLMGQGHVVCYNRISRFWDGIDFTGGVPAGPRSEWNCAGDFYNNEISECIDDAIEMDYGVHNIRVMRNFIYNVFDAISTQPVYGGPGYIVRNVVYNCTRGSLKLNNHPAGLLVYHNTLFDTFHPPPIWQNTQVRNNLFVGNEGDGFIWTGTLTPRTSGMDHNGYRTNGFTNPYPIWWKLTEPRLMPTGSLPTTEASCSNLAQFTEITGYEKHAIAIDYNIFIKAEPASGKPIPLPSLDLRLREGSVAVDAGEVLPNINDDFAGKAPDLGAYELGDLILQCGPRRSSEKSANN